MVMFGLVLQILDDPLVLSVLLHQDLDLILRAFLTSVARSALGEDDECKHDSNV